GLFSKELPNAGNGGPTQIMPNSAAIVNYVNTKDGLVPPQEYGQTVISNPGPSDFLGVSMYYGQATDPVYKLEALGCSADNLCGVPGSLWDVRNTYWHIPNQAVYPGGNSDMFFGVWDQT